MATQDMKQTADFKEMRANYDAIFGKGPADLLIKNARIVDVYTERVREGSILINGGKIVAIDPDESKIQPKEVMDAEHRYVAPGFIDAHCHIDSHLVTPAAFSQCIVPNGTTTLICEIEDFVGACKKDGVEATKVLFSHLDKLPYNLYLQAPGKKVKWEISREILNMEACINQGEFPELDALEGKDEVFEQVAYAKSIGKEIHSHSKYLDEDPYPVNMFPMMGSYNTHNVWDYTSLEQCLRLGINPMLREGVDSVLSCMEAAVPEMVNNHLPTDTIMLCTDNLTVDTIFRRGHLNYNMNRCIGFGISPIEAIRMGTLNAARSFKLDQIVGSVAPGRYADLVFLDTLQYIKPVMVMKNGKIVAKDGELLEYPDIDYAKIIRTPKPGLDDLKREDLKLEPLEISEDGKQAKLVALYMGMPAYLGEYWFPYENGKVVVPGDMRYLTVIERYPHNGKPRKIINGLVSQYNMATGAVASVYASLAPQICVVGENYDDMYAAAKALDQYDGGYLSVKDGKVTSVLPCEIYSTISTLTAKEFNERTKELRAAGDAIGYHEEDSKCPWQFRLQIMSWMLDRRRYVDLEEDD